MKACNKCHKEKPLDELCDGECFECSTGDTLNASADIKATREAMVNISKGLGDKTTLTGKSVRERMLLASKDNKMEDTSKGKVN